MRWSTRPESVMTTIRSRAGVSATTSRCRTVEVDSVGYCTIATRRVSWASSRTARAGRRRDPRRSPGTAGSRRPKWTTADVVDPIDELAVALLGGHPARAGVRLGDVALGPAPPCRRHRCAGDAEVVAFHQRLGSRSAPLGRDEVGDDGAEHLKATVVGKPIWYTSPSSPFWSSAAQLVPRPGECRDGAHRLFARRRRGHQRLALLRCWMPGPGGRDGTQ